MPRLSISSLPFKKKKFHLLPIYGTSLLLMFHTAIAVYINSTFLEKFLNNSESSIGTIYTIGSALTVLIFLFISRVLRKVGNYNLMLWLLILDFFAVINMAFADTLRVAVPLFIVHLTTVPLIVFNLDVFMEEAIGKNESSTGSKRGLLLGLLSLTSAISPVINGFLIGENSDLTYPYILSAIVLIPIIAILFRNFKDFSDPEYNEIDLFSAIRTFWKNRNIRNVLLNNLTLQMFFMLMVVYTPLYLTKEIGLSWKEFGIIMFTAQLAYVILEYPVGVIADKYIGEKEMMALGFLIIIISTSWISFTNTSSILTWCIILFTTRIGASLVEVTTESYFFKQTKSNDAQIISFFRLTQPLSYVIGTLLASLALLYVPFNLLFIVFAFLMIPAMFLTATIVDSK